jgi:hypothetical protein
MDDDFLSGDFEQPKRDNLFGWTVFILLLIALALVCWMGSFYIFGHPENPASYAVLKRLGKLDPPKRFEVTAAPAGEFLTPEKLYERYVGMSDFELKRENEELLRNYLRNYTDTKKLVPYLIGRFNVLDSFELTSKDIFGSGVVALAQAVGFPAVLIEHVYVSESSDVAQLRKMLMTGLDIKLMKTLDLSAVIHVEKIFDGRLQFTVVPLLYGTYAMAQGTGSFSLTPPDEVNLKAGMPILETKEIQEAFRTYALFQRGEPGRVTSEAEQTPAPTPPRVAVRTKPKPTPQVVQTPAPTPRVVQTPVQTPAIAAITPAPTPPRALESTPAPIPTVSPTPFVEARMTPEPAPVETPSPVEVATPEPAPVAVSPEGVPLQPFLVSSPTPSGRETGSWRTYSPGRMPRGRLIRSSEVERLADRGLSGERVYLRGDFLVTASGESRAVLRSNKSLQDDGDNTRIIVEYPSGMSPPVQGSIFSRDEMRPFQITDVRRGERGEINLYVREVTTP